MALAVNGAKTGVVNLVDLINFSNPTAVSITPAQVEFNNLAVYDNTALGKPVGTNTEVNIRSVNGQGFINGSSHPTGFSLFYRRVGLNTGVTSFTNRFAITVNTTWDQLRTAIAAANNQVYDDIKIYEQGVALGTDPIMNTVPPANSGEGNTQVFNLIPVGTTVNSAWVSTSYVYDTTTAAVTGNWQSTDTPLDQNITIRELDGFVPLRLYRH
jgi:hypothetical protein